MSTMDLEERRRRRTIRARNWALFVVLAALAALFYAVTVIRMGG